MMIMRPITRNDLGCLMDLARISGVGLTSLPVNEERLTSRIARSERSFSGVLPREDQGFVFVLEDCDRGMVVGISAIESAVGLREPWYNYRISTMVHACQELGIHKRHEALFLSNDLTGCSELCSLFLHPDYRRHRNGSLLSKSRLLFVAQFRHLFDEMLVAEMRGALDEQGQSPFWEGLGRHFFAMDFGQADYLTGVGQKTFVAELMPRHPIYTDLLPAPARAAICKTHHSSLPALAMLEAEGFRCEGYIDIFDGGPAVQAHVRDIRAVRESALRECRIGTPAAAESTRPCLVSNTSLADFRAVLLDAGDEEQLCLSPEQASALKLAAGDPVRCVALHADSRH
jgi:arginine N-succinyltransferase